MSTKQVVIIGAGLGGLSAAIHLAARGCRVIVLEKNARVGGKMGELQAAGYRFDLGPSVLTMRSVVADLFATADRQLSDYLTLLPVDPLTRYFYPDGSRIDVRRELADLIDALEAFAPGDVEGYLAYLAYAARLHRLTGQAFVYGPPPSLASLAQFSPFDLLRIDPLRTMSGAIHSFVRDPRLRQLLGRFATYIGASPYLAPATLNVISYVELAGGVWYPQGGMYALAQAYERLARELGVEIHLNTPVRRIVVREGAVQGVEVEAGEVVPAAKVIANVDVATVYADLLPGGAVPARVVRRILGRALSSSGFVLLLGLKGRHPELAHHNIFFSRAYRGEFEEIFFHDRPPTEPTVYVAITSKTDRSHAPRGGENWFVMVNTPALGSGWNWETRCGAYRNLVLARLAGHGLDVRPEIQYERILTPLEFAQVSGAYRGALYGASSNQRLAAFLRPHNRSPYVGGLYFAGGTTHPGGGAPMVTLSGKVAAGMLLEDWRK
ncbi:MAG: phytoene desaturase [Anaerolineales bacterium]|nr:phytoene desaturase [Anaerolineales bacterium]